MRDRTCERPAKLTTTPAAPGRARPVARASVHLSAHALRAADPDVHALLVRDSLASGTADALLRPMQERFGNAYVTQVVASVMAEAAPVLVPAPIATQILAARGGGQPLGSDVRQTMQEAFQHDFGAVRIHTGPTADEMSDALNARAFTVGSDVFFRNGELDPHSGSGRALLAHELAHVVQHAGRPIGTALTVSEPEDRAEREADAAAQAAISARPAQVSLSPAGPELRRQPRSRPQPRRRQISFEPLEIEVVPRGARSPSVDMFHAQFPTKLLAISTSFNRALQNFVVTMQFPPDQAASVDFQSVFLDFVASQLIAQYEKYVLPELEALVPGVGHAVALVSALRAESARATRVSGELALRDFILQIGTRFDTSILQQVDAFQAQSPRLYREAQAAWRHAETPQDRRAIEQEMQRVLAIPTPSPEDFQRQIVGAYIRSQRNGIERGTFKYTMLGRIEVSFDDDSRFEYARVLLRTGSGSAQVADQINRLFGKPIDLRRLGVTVFVQVRQAGIAGGRAYYGVILNPPDYAASPRDLGYRRFLQLPGDPLVVASVSG